MYWDSFTFPPRRQRTCWVAGLYAAMAASFGAVSCSLLRGGPGVRARMGHGLRRGLQVLGYRPWSAEEPSKQQTPHRRHAQEWRECTTEYCTTQVYFEAGSSLPPQPWWTAATAILRPCTLLTTDAVRCLLGLGLAERLEARFVRGPVWATEGPRPAAPRTVPSAPHLASEVH